MDMPSIPAFLGSRYSCWAGLALRPRRLPQGPKAPYGAKRCSWPALKHYFVRARRQVTAPTRVLVQAGINHPLISSLLGVQCRTRPRFKWIFGCDKEIYLGNTNTRGEIRSTPATTASGQRNPPTMPGTLEVWLQPPNSHAPTHLRASEPRSKAKFGLASTPRAPHHLQLLGLRHLQIARSGDRQSVPNRGEMDQ
jgi:hypothetical protein